MPAACAASVISGRSSTRMSALTQLTQIPPWPQDTRTHHGITTASSRISPTWPGGGGSSCLLGGEGRCYRHSLLPAHLRIAWRYRRSAAVWRHLSFSQEAPVASRDASTTLPGYLTLLNR
jgi:hypothetical protein